MALPLNRVMATTGAARTTGLRQNALSRDEAPGNCAQAGYAGSRPGCPVRAWRRPLAMGFQMPFPTMCAHTLLVVLFVIPTVRSAFADSPADPLAQVFQDWNDRRQDIRMLHCELRGTTTWYAGSLTHLNQEAPSDPKPNPESDVTGKFNMSIWLEPKGNRFRIERIEEEYDNLSRSVYVMNVITGGDGQGYWSRILENGQLASSPAARTRAKPHVDLFLVKADPENMITLDNFNLRILFLGLGIVPTQGHRIRGTTLVPHMDESEFSFRGWTNLGGTLHAVVRERTTDLWVDLEKQSAVERIVIGGDQPRLLAEIVHQHTEAGWLPRSWTFIQFVQSASTLRTDTAVEWIGFDPPGDAIVSPPREPGLYVEEMNIISDEHGLRSERAFFRINARGGITKLDENLYPASRIWVWRILLFTAIAVGPLLFFAWRRVQARAMVRHPT
jgi:hypothetical protein